MSVITKVILTYPGYWEDERVDEINAFFDGHIMLKRLDDRCFGGNKVFAREDPDCDACLAHLFAVVFDPKKKRVTLCRAHVLELIEHRVMDRSLLIAELERRDDRDREVCDLLVSMDDVFSGKLRGTAFSEAYLKLDALFASDLVERAEKSERIWKYNAGALLADEPFGDLTDELSPEGAAAYGGRFIIGESMTRRAALAIAKRFGASLVDVARGCGENR